jgi:2-polyprenyl-3-methyl-5-hydroxy-6-metoxy-1,4-benzoquinol methylase
MPFDESYFSTNTYKNVSFARYSQYWWSNRFYAILARRYGQHGRRLLEIGSGLGHLVAWLENDFKTFATDINTWAINQSLHISRCTTYAASCAEELPFCNCTFEVVIIKHVVEHLLHPETAICEIGRVTAPGGVLILSTPNMDSPARTWKGKGWIGYQDPTHISLKAPADWCMLVVQAGYKIQRIFSDGLWDAPYIPLIPKMLQKLLFGSLGGLQAILGLPFLSIRRGESIIMIARKNQ